ncbi:glucosyl-3-phosphoglycerate synthase [Natronoarchaeum philippinense]|uniref:Glucosyl-3-phosphoglycerate synthase n=1 Tax=Natronoarchaeum philippinense TaxID=558529 RepID=A0A285NTZ3_NATPI|nr:glycosyl transferase family 2 [Natronoarchaeum philippinense]SNZ12925.1 glucosyl-3-phosphoglycerate synthase [Natronoarchaeum philippinense]
MEYVQERIATLHDLTEARPDAPTGRSAVVVPMTDREYAGRAAERVLSTLADVDPGRVIVALRAPPERVGPFREWLGEFGFDADLLWCNGPAVETLLADRGLDGEHGKGRDVWLALGVAAADSEYVVVHDADAESYAPTHVPRLLAPLDEGYSFSKGYYARVENDRLYGRLYRLFVAPLVRALGDAYDDPVLDYLGAFRYALAGEFAATAELARSLRAQPGWGLEVGTLGETFEYAGFDGTAQVDLGTHEHDHRAVSGAAGLSGMAEYVGAALFRILDDRGIEVDYDAVREAYREAGAAMVDQYAADAAFNDLAFDRTAEREQVQTYAEAIGEPGPDRRLPAWTDAPLSPAEVVDAAERSLASIPDSAGGVALDD